LLGAPGWHTLFMPAGALAVGAALKLARLITGRYKAVGLWGSFHGASLDAISIGGERMFRDQMGPLLPGHLHAHPWVPGRSVDDAIDELDRLFRVEGDIGALLAEPIRWSSVVVPPVDYWRRVRQLCHRHGALLIFDEIGTCMGRTGRWFAFHHFDVTPDIVLTGKALGAGVMPQAAMSARAGLASPDLTGETALGHFTHEKNPLAAAASLAAIEILERDQLLPRATTLGAELLALLRARIGHHPSVKGVRGIGLLLALELDNPVEAERVMYDCLRKGLSFKVSSGRVITLVIPLNIPQTQLLQAIDMMCTAIESCA
jgi:4-aminobutyrate aminotransferase